MEIIDPRHLLATIAKILEDLKIPYFITGGMAITVWGRPRFTADVDIVVNLVEPAVRPLVRALKQISQAGYIDAEAAQEAIRKKGEFNFIEPDSGIKVDFWVSKDDELSRLQFQRRQEREVAGQKVFFISPEDLFLSKLLWFKASGSNRHTEDAASIWQIMGKKLDLKYLRLQAARLGIKELLEEIIYH